MFFGLPDFIILTLIFPLGLGVLIALDAAPRGQSDKACLVWLLFTWLLWPIAIIMYYLTVVEKYRGIYRTSLGIKASAAFLILLIIGTACAGITSPQAISTGQPAAPSKNPPKCQVTVDIRSFASDNSNVTVNVWISNHGGSGYVKIEYYTNKRSLAIKEYYIRADLPYGWRFTETFPWTSEDNWIDARIISQRPA